MKKILIALTLCCLLAMAAVASANVPSMDLALSKTKVEMGMTYAGDTVVVSGTAPAGSQLAIVLVSKDNPPLQLSRKGRVGPFWMSVKQLDACNLPYVYKLYTSGPLAQIASPDTVHEISLGYGDLKSRLLLKCTAGVQAPDDAQLTFDGFIKLKESAGLYGVADSSIKVGPDGKFEHGVFLSDRVAEGKYFINVYALKDGKLVASATREISAMKLGLSKWLAVTSKENGVMYGLMAVTVALCTGLGIGMVFRKGGGH
jgi:uncharacterized protein (TIGR02186 family)